jgi:preprotein translocase subunit Sec63
MSNCRANEILGDIQNNTRREVSRHFRNKTREFLTDEINELATDNRPRTSEAYIEE